MTTLYKKATIKFTAYKDFDCPQEDDLLDKLKTFCEDNDIEFEESILLDTRDECPICGKFENEIIEREMETGQVVEGCQKCIDNWEPEEQDEDHNSDR